MTCVHCHPPRLTRRALVADLARESRFRYLYFAVRLSSTLFEAARDAGPDERDKLRELARTLRAGARFAQRGAE